jgi:hypothetical protein
VLKYEPMEEEGCHFKEGHGEGARWVVQGLQVGADGGRPWDGSDCWQEQGCQAEPYPA